MMDFSLLLNYTPAAHQGVTFDNDVDAYVIFNTTEGFLMNTLALSAKEAQEKRGPASPGDQVAQLAFKAE